MKKLLWVDLEMTGLNLQTDVILELAAVVTDLDLNTVEQIHYIVRQPQSVLDKMDDWCTKTHGASGLTALVPNGTPLEEVENHLLHLIQRHFKKDERVVLTGNSVGNDRDFILKHMPKVASRLHYRLIDISSWKEIFRDRYGIEVKKANHHRAIDDIFESIKELQTYMGYINLTPKTQKAGTHT